MRKNIWIMNHYAANMFNNQGGRHYWFAKNLKQKGYAPTIFCANALHKGGEMVNLGDEKYKLDKTKEIPFVFVKTTPAIGNGIDRVKNMICFSLNLFPSTKAVARESGIPDIILASSVHPLTMIAGILIAKRYKIPCICEVRDLWPESIVEYGSLKKNSILAKLLYAGEKWIYKKADALIFTMEGGYDYITERGWDKVIPKEKVHYINNGVDLEAFDYNSKNYITEDVDLDNKDIFKVVYAGTIRKANNLGILLDSAKLLLEKGNKKIKFLIWGDGTELEQLRKRVIAEEITNVCFKGRVERTYVPFIVSNADLNIYILDDSPLNRFGLSLNKSFEYFAAGKPVLASANSGYSIINQYKLGVALDSYSIENLTKEIIRFSELLVAEYDAYCKNACKAAQNFNFKELTDKLTEVIEGV